MAKHSDEEIINTIKEHKVVKLSELLPILNYASTKNMKRRLDKLKFNSEIQSTVLPATRHKSTKVHIFDGYVNVPLYYISEKELEAWVWGKLPTSMPPAMRRALTQRLKALGLELNLAEKSEYKGISFPKDTYEKLQKKAKKINLSMRDMVIKKCLEGKNE